MPENPYGTMLTTPGPGDDWYDPCILSDYYYTYEAGSYNSQTGEWSKGLVWSGGCLCCRLTGVRKSTSSLVSNGYFSAKDDNNTQRDCVLIGIAPDAFKGQTRLNSITIPNSVWYIEQSAFWGCTWLNTVTFSEGSELQGIGSYAFYNCERLTSINIPNSVPCISDYTFAYCSALTDIAIPRSARSIGSNAFSGCTSLENIVIPDSVTSIGSSAFYNCTSLTSITIPDSVTTIGYWAFYGCSKLTSITIPNSVTSIGKSAFYNCASLENITLPFAGASINGAENTHFGYIFGASSYQQNSARVPVALKNVVITGGKSSTGGIGISSYAFYGCEGLTSVALENWVFNIGSYAFYNCTRLVSVEILNNVATIGSYAFYNCYRLTSIEIPDSVTSIGDSAFEDCYKLIEVYNRSSLSITKGSTANGYIGKYAKNIYTPTSGASKLFTSGDYLFYNDNGSYLLVAYTGADTLIDFPDTINDTAYAIYDYAFYYRDDISSVTINGAKDIGQYAFYRCSSLRHITIGTSVESINSYAFLSCANLASITVDINNETYHSAGNCLIKTASKTLVLGCKNSIIPADESVTDIGNYAFNGCTGLLQIAIPEGVTRIGSNAFSLCSSLESITISDSVTNIGSSAFYNTGYYNNQSNWVYDEDDNVLYIGKHLIKAKTSLSGEYIVKDGTLCISDQAFYNCTSLTNLVIPDGVTSIGDFAFKMCTSLALIAIPNSVSSLGQGAFQSCYSLTYIKIPDRVTSISNGVFQNCSSLGSIEIQNKVTSIGEYAFDGCESLTSITIPSSVTTIGFGAIQGCTSLTSITIPFVGQTALNQTSGSYLYRIGYIFGASAGNAADALPESLKEIIVNQGTPFLANQAFAFANKVETIQIKLADSVKAFCFGRAAFYGCTALETFKLTEASEGVAPILDKLDCLSDSIFANCYDLANIVLPHTKAFAASAYEALQIQTAPVAVDLETPGLPATLIGKGQTADYNIFLQITPPTNIATTNFSIDGLYGNVTINGQTTLKRLASMSSIKTSYEKLADHISHDTPSDFVEALSNISLVGYSPVSVLQMYYSLELTFNDGTQANVGVQTSTCSAINVLEEDEAGNYVTSTRISYDTSGFLEQIDSVWRPLPLTTVQTLVARRSTGTQAYSTSTIGGSFFAYTSARLDSGTVSITAPQRLIHAFMRDTNDNKYRLNSIAFSCTTDESEVGGFAGCSSLASASYVSIYDDDKLILADYAFSKCSNLTSFSSDYITSIGYAAFQLCSSLQTVSLPRASALDTQDRYGFDDDWGDAQSAVGSSLAFYNCEKLQTLVLDFNEIESIGDYAFSGCAKLSWKNVTGPDWSLLGSIGYHAFLNCSTLTTIGKIDSVQNIYFGAFQGCTSLTSITVPQVHTQVNTSKVSILQYNNFGAFFGASQYQYNSDYVPASLEKVAITGGDSIGSGAFDSCSSLTYIKIPDGVTSIGSYAFEDCDSLTSIEIPDSVKSIGSAAFRNCSKLTSIMIPSSVTSISNGVFRNCQSLASIEIPKQVIEIGASAFSGCAALTYITFAAREKALVVHQSAFSSIGIGEDGETKLPLTIVADSLQDYAYCSFSGAEDSLCARGTTRIVDTNGTLYTHLHILPDKDYTIGDYAFYKWKPAYEVAVFAPEDPTKISFGTGALAINGTLYWYDTTANKSVTVDGKELTIVNAIWKKAANKNISVTDNSNDTDSPKTLIKSNFGLNNWLSDLPPDDDTAIAHWKMKATKDQQDRWPIDAFLPNHDYTSQFTLQGLGGKLIKSNSTEPLQFQYTAQDSKKVNIVLASAYQVDFVGTITLPTGLSNVQVYTGNKKACKRRVVTIEQTETGLSVALTLPIGKWVAIKALGEPIHEDLPTAVGTQQTVECGSHEISLKRLAADPVKPAT